MSAPVRTPGPGHSGSPSRPTCTVELEVADALGVAHSIRTLVRGRKLPPGTAEVYDRVAKQMISSARLAMAQGGGR